MFQTRQTLDQRGQEGRGRWPGTQATDSVPILGKEVGNQVPELQHERELARACGFDFRVGVRSTAHRAALLNVDRTLTIVVMDWC